MISAVIDEKGASGTAVDIGIVLDTEAGAAGTDINDVHQPVGGGGEP